MYGTETIDPWDTVDLADREDVAVTAAARRARAIADETADDTGRFLVDY